MTSKPKPHPDLAKVDLMGRLVVGMDGKRLSYRELTKD